jgi:hypothetical protein
MHSLSFGIIVSRQVYIYKYITLHILHILGYMECIISMCSSYSILTRSFTHARSQFTNLDILHLVCFEFHFKCCLCLLVCSSVRQL